MRQQKTNYFLHTNSASFLRNCGYLSKETDIVTLSEFRRNIWRW